MDQVADVPTPAGRVVIVCRRLWMWVAGLVGMLGIFETLLVARTVASASFAVIVGVFVAFGHQAMHREGSPSPPVRKAVKAGAVATVTAVASIGLAALLSDGALLLVLLITAATSPPVVRLVVGRARHASKGRDSTRQDQQPAGTSAPADHLAAVVRLPATHAAGSFDHSAAATATMPTAELCSAWRGSSAMLERLTVSGDMVQQRRLVDVRQRYLDEFERRDPLGFQRWLHAGAEPGSDPSAYLDADEGPTGPRV